MDCVCESIKASLPRSWVERIEKEGKKVGNWGIPDMFIVKNDEKKHLAGVTMKEIYKMLVEKEIKLPASESVWPKVFPDFNVKAIWKNLSVSEV